MADYWGWAAVLWNQQQLQWSGMELDSTVMELDCHVLLNKETLSDSFFIGGIGLIMGDKWINLNVVF